MLFYAYIVITLHLPRFPVTSSHCNRVQNNLALILECKRLKKKRKRTEGEHSGPLPATIEMLNISMCVCVFY